MSLGKPEGWTDKDSQEVIDAAYKAHLKRSYIEDGNYENGNYMCLCGQCGLTFIGHKRRVVCKDCKSNHSNVEGSK